MSAPNPIPHHIGPPLKMDPDQERGSAKRPRIIRSGRGLLRRLQEFGLASRRDIPHNKPAAPRHRPTITWRNAVAKKVLNPAAEARQDGASPAENGAPARGALAADIIIKN